MEEKNFTKEYFIEQGRKGGLQTKKKYGKKHFKKLVALREQKKLSTARPLTNEGVDDKI